MLHAYQSKVSKKNGENVAFRHGGDHSHHAEISLREVNEKIN